MSPGGERGTEIGTRIERVRGPGPADTFEPSLVERGHHLVINDDALVDRAAEPLGFQTEGIGLQTFLGTLQEVVLPAMRIALDELKANVTAR